MHQVLNNTVLKDRILWFDGDSSYQPENIEKALMSKNDCSYVTELTSSIEQYNNIIGDENRITVKRDINSLTFDWNIPDQYKKLDVHQYIFDKLVDEFSNNNWTIDKDKISTTIRANRVAKELDLYKKHGLMDVLKVIIFVINTLNANNIVWGVGRGSSVASYVLYLIGIHDVDSVKFDLDINDFLH